jgi:dTDP-4-dehydrorhamnose reductase
VTASAKAKRPILLFGASGQVGWQLLRALAPFTVVVAPSRSDIDIADAHDLRADIREPPPDLVVNAAAYTEVDGAETDEPRALAVNGRAPAVMAEAAAALGVPLVHYSTDYVFDGAATEPYAEDDTPAPLNAYGRTKLAGEAAVLEGRGPHLVFRTSWVYGWRGRNFLLTIERLARERETTALALARCWRPGSVDPLSAASGLYHVAAKGETSWHGFASAIVDEMRAARDPDLRARTVRAITSAEFPRPARRPARSVLDCAKLEERFSLALPDWRFCLALTLADRASLTSP